MTNSNGPMRGLTPTQMIYDELAHFERMHFDREVAQREQERARPEPSPRPPKFHDVESADRWMAAQERKKKRAELDEEERIDLVSRGVFTGDPFCPHVWVKTSTLGAYVTGQKPRVYCGECGVPKP